MTYPQDWAGHFSGMSISGSIDIKGENVDHVRRGGNPAYKKVDADVEGGDSKMICKTTSGKIDVFVKSE